MKTWLLILITTSPIFLLALHDALGDLTRTIQPEFYYSSLRKTSVPVEVQESIDAIKREHFNEASEVLKLLLKEKPNCVEGLCNMGVVEAYFGHNEKAFYYYGQAIANDETLTEAFFNRANLHLKTCQFQKAAEGYAEVVKQNPDDDEALSGEGQARILSGQFSDGLTKLIESDDIRISRLSAFFFKSTESLYRSVSH